MNPESEPTESGPNESGYRPDTKPKRKPRVKQRPLVKSALLEPDALAKAKAAAEAVGLTVEQLGDLLVDSGLYAMPPDGVVQRFTLEDLGMRLWSTMQSVPRSRRYKWFEGLTVTQQSAVVVVLRERGFASATIANDFRIDPMEVTRIYNKHADQLGAQVVGLRLDTIAGHMQLAAERAQEMAIERHDPRAFWAVEKEKIGLMQDLGIVDRAVHKTEVTHRLDENQVQEIEQLANLRRKQEVRRNELQRITVEVQQGDELPEELEEDYE